MRIDILTLFPSMFDGVISTSIIKRAIESNKVSINIIDFRKYSKDLHHKVDDTPYGGGAGMVLSIQPIYDCINDIKTDDSYIILTSPRGKRYNQSKAIDLSQKKHIIIICGHYEGIDERVNELCDDIISIGDFVLTGGEIPAMAITDSVVRLIDGVISKESLDSESFNGNLLDFPVYTKPYDFMGMKVPDVLISGDHKKIDEYRKSQQLLVDNN